MGATRPCGKSVTRVRRGASLPPADRPCRPRSGLHEPRAPLGAMVAQMTWPASPGERLSEHGSVMLGGRRQRCRVRCLAEIRDVLHELLAAADSGHGWPKSGEEVHQRLD